MLSWAIVPPNLSSPAVHAHSGQPLAYDRGSQHGALQVLGFNSHPACPLAMLSGADGNRSATWEAHKQDCMFPTHAPQELGFKSTMSLIWQTLSIYLYPAFPPTLGLYAAHRNKKNKNTDKAHIAKNIRRVIVKK